MQYSSSFPQEKIQGLSDINNLLKQVSFIEKKDIEDTCYLFKLPEGEYVTFGLHGDNLLTNLNSKTLELLDEKYDVQNKLFSYYKNMVFHGILKNKELYIFFVIYIDNEFCPGLYETSNLLSMLGFNFVNVIDTKISVKDVLVEDCILTQRSGVDFSNKVFMLT